MTDFVLFSAIVLYVIPINVVATMVGLFVLIGILCFVIDFFLRLWMETSPHWLFTCLQPSKIDLLLLGHIKCSPINVHRILTWANSPGFSEKMKIRSSPLRIIGRYQNRVCLIQDLHAKTLLQMKLGSYHIKGSFIREKYVCIGLIG